MEPNLLNAPPAADAATTHAPTEPAPRIPEKFRDPRTGEVRIEALLKSYQELERKLARMVEVPDEGADEAARVQFRRRLGIPDRPEDYPVQAPHRMIQPDAELNRVLHAAEFTPRQVQLVYNLAAERMLPAIQQMAGEFEADRQMERLVEHFGGPDKWREVASALAAWGRRNLPGEVFDALSTTFEGVEAMHRMMASEEPGLVGGELPGNGADEDELRRLMADPKYWRDRDPATIKRVTEGFRKLFPG